MTGLRLLCCGGRDYDDREHIRKTLSEINAQRGPVSCLIHGGQAGADLEAGLWAELAGIEVLEFIAHWGTEGRAAGPIRNSRMIREGEPDLVVAFPGGVGTANLVAQARRAGVEIVEVRGRSDYVRAGAAQRGDL